MTSMRIAHAPAEGKSRKQNLQDGLVRMNEIFVLLTVWNDKIDKRKI